MKIPKEHFINSCFYLPIKLAETVPVACSVLEKKKKDDKKLFFFFLFYYIGE